jgi:methylglutaconyl-CoA hydratase
VGVKDETVDQDVLEHLEDGVLTLTINRPERRNAIDGATADLLHAAVLAVRDDPSCRVIVITGAGRAFCAGWDIQAIAELRGLDAPEVERSFERNRGLLEDLERAPQATIASVHGAVMGFGLGLVASCDIAVAAESTAVGLPEIALGVVPALVMVDLFERLPEKVALDWLLSGERRTAAQGLAAGLFSRVVGDDAVDTEVSALAAVIAGHDPAAVRETKRLYRSLRSLEHDAAIREAIASAAAALVKE